jgi:ABC-type amino acid transport substrate-binding protein
LNKRLAEIKKDGTFDELVKNGLNESKLGVTS